MTDSLEFLPEPESQQAHPASKPIAAVQQQETVTVKLPVDVLAALGQHGYQSEQTQTQIILEVLRSALGLPAAESHPSEAPALRPAPPTIETAATAASASLLAEVEQLKIRLRQLEALIPKLEDLQGKSIAFWQNAELFFRRHLPQLH